MAPDWLAVESAARMHACRVRRSMAHFILKYRALDSTFRYLFDPSRNMSCCKGDSDNPVR
ncbi:hypothetical protein HYPSUDRAFT_67758 [Hypholoma sublateritium FD-334 SS-4]|uniref:Uncharacterized protein n=1 Tax=Hypholoma sublateritium (strain FD-334 SS-4) TaxID=945553 RepID=A0A0D2NY51_HYPSF|nr:hypothetical protein HYPSUDRAFT_67758 [Hypholoma sublateritium FD-334 SS-4]